MPPSTRPSSSQSSIHQHPKLHAPQHPAVKLAKQHPPAPQTACPLAPSRQARKAASTSTSNCMPPSTRPSISQSSIHQHLAPGRQARKAASTSTSTCMPPSTRPSISQITFPSLLEVRTPIAFSYLGKNKTKQSVRGTPAHALRRWDTTPYRDVADGARGPKQTNKQYEPVVTPSASKTRDTRKTLNQIPKWKVETLSATIGRV